MNLEQEAERATELLRGKVVAKVMRHRAEEVCVEFDDGTRLFVDHKPDDLEVSISGGDEE